MNDRTESDTRQRPQEGYFIPARGLPQHSEVSFGDLLAILRQFRLVIAATALVCLLGATALALFMRPVYRAEVVMAPLQVPQLTGGMQSLAGQLPGLVGLAGISADDGETQRAMATLRSRKFTTEFIHDNHLLPALFAVAWDSEAEQWTVSPDEQPTLWDAYALFHQSIRSISQDNVTGIVTIAIEWHDPVVAATWANELVNRLNTRMRDRAVAEGERSLNYLRQQFDTTSLVELRQSLAHLIETQLNKVMLVNSRDEYLFRVIDPAVAPDSDDFVRPNRPLLIAAGGLGGLFLGLLLALTLSALGRTDPDAS